MAVLPEKDFDLINFCLQHQNIWALDPEGVGLDTTQVSLLKNYALTAQASYDAASNAREASKSATVVLRNDVSTMREYVADLVRTIKAYAENQSNPSAVYAQAQIPPPASPTPAPLPGRPENFSVVLNSDGSVTLSWDAINAAASGGVYFAVSRKLPGQSSFTQIGGAAGITTENRRAFFTDASIPVAAAAQGAQYIVQGFRGTRGGPTSDAIVVQFGVDGVGAFTVGGASLKIAA